MDNSTPELFFLRNFNVDRIFGTIERVDFLPLYYIRACSEESGPRVYLTTLSERMDITIPELSKMAEKLQDKGYISWKTDMAEGRTYVELTSKAVELMNDVRVGMKTSYQRIQEEISPEELEQTTRTMRRITAILEETMSNADHPK